MLANETLKPIGPYVVGQIVDYIERQQEEVVITSRYRRWHVLLIEPQQERRVAVYLTAYRFKVYLPTIPYRTTRGCRRVKVEVERPMFPGYLFIRFDPDLDDGKRRQRIDIAQGVREFMKLDGEHAIISEADLLRVEQEEKYQHDPTRRAAVRFGYDQGEMVRVTDGPFQGFNGTIGQLDDRGRIKVLLSLLGRAVPTEMTVDDICKL